MSARVVGGSGPAARNLLQHERLAAIREAASASIAELDARIAAITAARADANSDDEHDPEGATIAFERAQAEALRDAARRRLRDVDAALAGLADGTYGRCAVCGEPIPSARLEARPTATTCLQHAR